MYSQLPANLWRQGYCNEEKYADRKKYKGNTQTDRKFGRQGARKVISETGRT